MCARQKWFFILTNVLACRRVTLSIAVRTKCVLYHEQKRTRKKEDDEERKKRKIQRIEADEDEKRNRLQATMLTVNSKEKKSRRKKEEEEEKNISSFYSRHSSKQNKQKATYQVKQTLFVEKKRHQNKKQIVNELIQSVQIIFLYNKFLQASVRMTLLLLMIEK